MSETVFSSQPILMSVVLWKKIWNLPPHLPGKPVVLICLLSAYQSVQSLSHVWLLATPWTTAHQASLFITNSQSLLKLISIESVMPSNHLILCRALLLLLSIVPRFRSFQMSQFFASGGRSIGISASISVLPMNIQDLFPLGWLVWSPCSQGTLKSCL